MSIKVVNTNPDFHLFYARDFVNNHLKNRGCIDFQKIDLKRSRKSNAEILKLFDQIINSAGMYNVLLWYKSQNWLLYLYKDIKTNLLKFYGCNKNIDHHSSNIEYIIKPFLHKILRDNGGEKLLIDNYSFALVNFGILPLFRKDQFGNVYQGFDGRKECNVNSFSVRLSEDQINLARKILRLIKYK